MFGEEDPTTLPSVKRTTHMLGEENPHTTDAIGEEDPTTLMVGEEGGGTTHLMGEEIRMTTLAVGRGRRGIAGNTGWGRLVIGQSFWQFLKK